MKEKILTAIKEVADTSDTNTALEAVTRVNHKLSMIYGNCVDDSEDSKNCLRLLHSSRDMSRDAALTCIEAKEALQILTEATNEIFSSEPEHIDE